MSALLDIRGVTRRYPQPRRHLLHPEPPLVAVNDVSARIAPGETLGIVGESGSGKTTLARMVMGFETPDEGQVLFDGEDLHDLSAAALRQRRRAFQMIFQDPYGSLDPRRSVGWSVAQPLRAIGQTSNRRAVEDVLHRVGLDPADGNRFPHEFSGGQRQRIAIARAIASRPKLIVADEAVSALDVSVRAQILNLLMDLQEEFGLAMLFISHDLSVVASLCDSLLVLRGGRTVEHGPAQDILAAPATEYTATLLAAARLDPPTGVPA
ncbi:ATP-binding cassette domain-containing protein [Rhodalgimonas zhirmunskyi]|uniref:ATP-binding cassette domain-containing protein n=1 Tax=Rhodalgimonas zhirmunskyi TaxID=2964767 RepID=A0AAJ1U5H9_9RHOB|nr:ATP-binding cassette domain-containing protein [Rhodoalgimonas zhirmunskyi]MDQ2093404.1 ATP-binding cassette domain-containing protein [Rhodoalgimonas zhirmunskyi]